MARNKPRRDKTEVSCVIKYLLFGFNVLFWVVGGMTCAVGLWAWYEKDMFSKVGKLTSIKADPALFFIILGAVVFFIGFTGCVGALRENTALLLTFSVCVGVVLFLQLATGIVFFVYKDWFSILVGIILTGQLAAAIMIFIYKDWVKDQVQSQLYLMITNYREDIDLQNLIDWVQSDLLKCCGVKDYNDWDKNIYFNCSSPSRERCGVPYSCCQPNDNDIVKNYQCGYDVRKEPSTPESVIYTTGCLEAGEKYFNTHLIPIAGIIVGIALVQILGICFAQNLRSDIYAQMDKWKYTN